MTRPARLTRAGLRLSIASTKLTNSCVCAEGVTASTRGAEDGQEIAAVHSGQGEIIVRLVAAVTSGRWYLVVWSEAGTVCAHPCCPLLRPHGEEEDAQDADGSNASDHQQVTILDGFAQTWVANVRPPRRRCRRCVVAASCAARREADPSRRAYQRRGRPANTCKAVCHGVPGSRRAGAGAGERVVVHQPAQGRRRGGSSMCPTVRLLRSPRIACQLVTCHYVRAASVLAGGRRPGAWTPFAIRMTTRLFSGRRAV